MNMDVGELIQRIRIRNPAAVAGIAGLLVATVLFALMARSLVVSIVARNRAEAEYASVHARVERIQSVQLSTPENLRNRIAEAKAQLAEVLAGFPTPAQAAEELSQYYHYAEEHGIQVLRMEALLGRPEGEDARSAYRVQRFVIEVQGQVPDLMLFLSRVGAGPYATFGLDGVAIVPDQPARASADLTVFSSDLVEEVEPGSPEKGTGAKLTLAGPVEGIPRADRSAAPRSRSIRCVAFAGR